MIVWQSMSGFDGRLPRKYFWLAGVVLMILWIVIFLILLHWLSGGQWLDEKYGQTLHAAKITGAVGLATFVVLLYPSLAVWIKRLHDLNLSGWWCVPAFVLGGIYPLAQVAHLTGPPDSENLLGNVLSWGSLAVGLVYVIVLARSRHRGNQRIWPGPIRGLAAVVGIYPPLDLSHACSIAGSGAR